MFHRHHLPHCHPALPLSERMKSYVCYGRPFQRHVKVPPPEPDKYAKRADGLLHLLHCPQPRAARSVLNPSSLLGSLCVSRETLDYVSNLEDVCACDGDGRLAEHGGWVAMMKQHWLVGAVGVALLLGLSLRLSPRQSAVGLSATSVLSRLPACLW